MDLMCGLIDLGPPPIRLRHPLEVSSMRVRITGSLSDDVCQP